MERIWSEDFFIRFLEEAKDKTSATFSDSTLNRAYILNDIRERKNGKYLIVDTVKYGLDFEMSAKFMFKYRTELASNKKNIRPICALYNYPTQKWLFMEYEEDDYDNFPD